MKSAKKRKKQNQKSVFCVVCKDPYVKYTEEVEKWIQCDRCLGMCMKSGCPHPICASGKDPRCCWYDGVFSNLSK